MTIDHLTGHVTVTCPCGSTDFRGRIEPTFRLRYTSTAFEVSPVFEAPEPIDVYCAGCGAAPWNLEMCDADAVLALAQASAEMTVAVAAIHGRSLAASGPTTGATTDADAGSGAQSGVMTALTAPAEEGQ